jgi:hypothetical protein
MDFTLLVYNINYFITEKFQVWHDWSSNPRPTATPPRTNKYQRLSPLSQIAILKKIYSSLDSGIQARYIQVHVKIHVYILISYSQQRFVCCSAGLSFINILPEDAC